MRFGDRKIAIIQYFVFSLFFSGLGSASASDESALVTDIGFANVEWLRLSDRKEVYLEVNDEVSEGCWKTPQSTKTAVELEFTRSGFRVGPTEGRYIPRVIISSLGFRTSDLLCVVAVRLDVLATANTNYNDGAHYVGGSTRSSLYSRDGVLVSPGDASDSIKTSHVDFVQAFLVQIENNAKTVILRAIINSDNNESRSHWEKRLLEKETR